jgi:hypothetical protein
MSPETVTITTNNTDPQEKTVFDQLREEYYKETQEPICISHENKTLVYEESINPIGKESKELYFDILLNKTLQNLLGETLDVRYTPTALSTESGIDLMIGNFHKDNFKSIFDPVLFISTTLNTRETKKIISPFKEVPLININAFTYLNRFLGYLENFPVHTNGIINTFTHKPFKEKNVKYLYDELRDAHLPHRMVNNNAITPFTENIETIYKILDNR